MTVWSVEQLTAEAKKHMRLPRARSTPTSRHCALPPVHVEAGAAVASSREETPRTMTSFARPGTFFRSASAARQSNPVTGSRASNMGRSRMKADLTPTKDARSGYATFQQARSEPLRHVTSASQFNTDMNWRPPPEMPSRGADVERESPDIQSRENWNPSRDLLHPAESSHSHAVRAEKAPLAFERLEFSASMGSPPVRHPGLDHRAKAQDFSATAPAPIRPRTPQEPDCSPKKLSRQLSLLSDDALRQLGKLDLQLVAIEKHVEQLNHLAKGSSEHTAESVGKMRTDLAQLEADANKLETKGVDNVYTSELKSGRQAAKELKSSQLRRLETLFGVIEKLFSFLALAL